MPSLEFSGVLFFPVTPFGADGSIDHALLADHVSARVTDGAGAVFAGCGTGEFHALSFEESTAVTATAVRAADGAVPVLTGAGGPVAQIVRSISAAEDAGADGVLLLPPYLVSGSPAGLRRYVEAAVEASSLPVIVYHRGTASYTPALMADLATDKRVIGFKDGIGDVAVAQQIVDAVTAVRGDDFAFFNGLLTAELSQAAYRGIGIPLYSSAAFAMAPEIAQAFYLAYSTGDEPTRLRILREFYSPLVALRDEAPGFGVSLVKAGLRLNGVDVGGVRAPLTDPNADQLARLTSLLEQGRRLADELAASGLAA